jgi:protein-S-isoprenylcysteine O-methyltransferase Ste14
VWVVSEITIGIRVIGRVGTRRQDRLSGPALIAGILVAVYASIGAAYRWPGAAIPFARSEIFAIGVLLALAGIALRQYAVVVLGRFFTTRVMTTSDQKVVDRGPYRFVRHPSYTGALMTVAGLVLCATNWLSLSCFLLTLPGLAYRIRVEEGVLIEGLGQPYRAYMSRTKRLVPFIV